MTDLQTLLSEAAAGSRELDGAIRARFVGDFYWCDYGTGTTCGEAPNCSDDGCGKALGILDERTSLPMDWRDDEHLPAYTTSIDAALALIKEVLPDATWLIGNEKNLSKAELFRDGQHFVHGVRMTGEHKSPAIALILALLAATEAQDD